MKKNEMLIGVAGVVLIAAVLSCPGCSSESAVSSAKQKPVFKSVVFKYSPVTGIGKETGVTRRDPSDVIKVGDLYYVWYTKVTSDVKLYPSGYNGVVCYAVSSDQGLNWQEKGLAVGLGASGSFDSFGVFTPNIIKAGGKYYLYYTAVAEGFDNKDYCYINKTAIGVAVSDSPDGPWEKYSCNPILIPSSDYEKFDSFRVDDSCLIKYGGKYRLYYKGRQMNNTPSNTKMGVAESDSPVGPFVRLNRGDPVQSSGHEVLIWKYGRGILSLVSNHGPQGRTVQFATDGLSFLPVTTKRLVKQPSAPGGFRAELTDSDSEQLMNWGISMATYSGSPYLHRFEIVMDTLKGSKSPRVK